MPYTKNKIIKELVKYCPQCNKKQTYTQVGSFNRAVRENVICKECVSENENNKKPDYIIDTKTNCWNWNKQIMNGGYGVKHGMLAHRFYYEKYIEEIPKNLELDHLCRNRKCVNPDHLEPVTKAVNQQRGLNSKLNIEQVKEIRKIGNSLPQRITAKQFNVSQRLIWNILHRKAWL